MKVLHLIDPAAPGGGPCTLRLVAEAVSRIGSIEHEVLVIGTAGHHALAARCGLSPCRRIAGGSHRAVIASAHLRHAVAALENRGKPVDLIHAWTDSSAAAARAVGRRAVMDGLPIDPAVDPEVMAGENRPLLRERWQADETTFVIGLLGEPAEWCDAETALAAVGRVALTGRDVKLLMHHRAARHSPSIRWLGKLGLTHMVIVDDEIAEPWRILPGLDAAMLATRRRPRPTAPGPASRLAGRAAALLGLPGPGYEPAMQARFCLLPLLWAMAAGVPVIADDRPGWSRIIDNGRTGLLFEPGRFNAAATHVLDLFADARTADRLGKAARKLVEEKFNPGIFADRLERLYRGDGDTRQGAAAQRNMAPPRARLQGEGSSASSGVSIRHIDQ